MVSVLDCGSSGPGSGPGRGHCVLFKGTQVYKWIPAKMLASHPGGSRNTPSRFMLRKPEISAGLMGLARLLILFGRQGIESIFTIKKHNNIENNFAKTSKSECCVTTIVELWLRFVSFYSQPRSRVNSILNM